YHWNFGDGDTSFQFGSVDHSYTSPGLFSVILICESDKGCGDFKLKPNLVNPWPVSIHDNIKNSLRVFPNPTSDNLMIYSEESVMDKIQLLDVMGKIHYSRDDLFVNKYEIENKGLKGTYFLKVEFSTALSMIIAVVFY
ncbi:MAG: T9SS type A sorting domain-containing protein, partial [Bacteroidetes bacterium]|nr:T9SS type A sorting domain-containing protein [Bacteroidota bacterium]